MFVLLPEYTGEDVEQTVGNTHWGHDGKDGIVRRMTCMLSGSNPCSSTLNPGDCQGRSYRGKQAEGQSMADSPFGYLLFISKCPPSPQCL